MSDHLKNLLIGIFVVTTLGIAISLIFFLEPKVGDNKQTLFVRFSNISGIAEGTRVTFAGKPVGEVQKIEEVPHARQGPMDPLGRVFFYQLTLKVDSSVEMYDTDEISVQTSGLLGEKIVAIVPKAPPKGVVPRPIAKDHIVYANSIDPVENALHQVGNVASSVNHLIHDANQWFDENKQELTNAVHSFSNAVANADQILEQFHEQKIITSVKNAIDVFTQDLMLAQNILSQIDEGNTVMRANQALDGISQTLDLFNENGRQILQNIQVITSDVADGSGTIGKLIKSDDFYLKVSSILSKANTLMNDINHYGLLFQYDKHWQRARTKRANLLQSLDNPKGFKSFFSQEIDAIHTSLSRIHLLLEKAETNAQRQQLLEDPCFRQDFADLLRQAQNLTKSLQTFNEELVDQEDCG